MDFTHSPVFSTVLIIVILGWVVYRQVRPRQLHARALILIPLILLYLIAKALPSFHPTHSQLVEIGITSLMSLGFGLLACRQLRVYASPTTGKAMAAGSWTYFLWWLASFAVKAGLAILFGETSVQNINSVELLLPVLFLMTTRNAYLFWRAQSLGLALH